MTWEIVAGIITLLSAVIAIGKIVANNTTALTEMKCSIDELRKTLEGQKSDIDNHEQRIKVLEDDKLIRDNK